MLLFVARHTLLPPFAFPSLSCPEKAKVRFRICICFVGFHRNPCPDFKDLKPPDEGRGFDFVFCYYF